MTSVDETPGHQLIHERNDESKVFFQRVVKRSSGPISRGPGGDRVAVKDLSWVSFRWGGCMIAVYNVLIML